MELENRISDSKARGATTFASVSFANILECIPDAAILVDQSGEILVANVLECVKLVR